jgi:hypothetical protein
VNHDRFIWWAGQAWGPVMRLVKGLGQVGSEWCKLAHSTGYVEATPTLSIGVVYIYSVYIYIMTTKI